MSSLDTEVYTRHLAQLVASSSHARFAALRAKSSLRIVDLCSGTGCISLLLHSLLRRAFPTVNLQITGHDIFEKAIHLSRANLRRNCQSGALDTTVAADVSFIRHDIFSQDLAMSLHDYTVDIIISNPPYISTQGLYDGTTERSVRLYEPKLALVPAAHLACEPFRQDIFYARLLELYISLCHSGSCHVDLKDKRHEERRVARVDTTDEDTFQAESTPVSKILVMEVGGDAQAQRVVAMVIDMLATLCTKPSAMAQQAEVPHGTHVPTVEVEIWCDSLPQKDEDSSDPDKMVWQGMPQIEDVPGYRYIDVLDCRVRVKGKGIMRAVVVYFDGTS